MLNPSRPAPEDESEEEENEEEPGNLLQVYLIPQATLSSHTQSSWNEEFTAFNVTTLTSVILSQPFEKYIQ